MNATVAWFRDIEKWSMPKILRLTSKLPNGWSLASIGNLVNQVTEKVRVEKDKEYKLIGVKWYSEGTFHRETVKGSEISATYLTPVIPKAFIYNRLFAWKQSFAVVPPEHNRHFVSNEFPQFIVDQSRLLPEYLYLIFRLQKTIKVVLSTSIGSAAVSRNRFKEEEFLKFEIPLPPLETQRAIVTRWREAQEDVIKADEQAKQLDREIILAVKTKLGRNATAISKQSKAFSLKWSDIERWGVSIAWTNNNRSITNLFKTRMVAELCKISSGGTPSRKIPQYFRGDIPWVKTTEVRDDVVFETEEHISSTGLQNSSAKIYPKGSLLVAMYGQGATRGRTAKLGIDAATNQACAVLTNFSPETNPEYLWVYLMSEYDDLRSMASGNNQPNLNAAMIANYPVPLPSLDIQKEIVKQFFDGRAKAAQERERATQIRQQAEAEIEARILGTKRVY